MSLILDGTLGVLPQTWTTVTRPATPVAGQQGFNSTQAGIEFYNGTAWPLVPGEMIYRLNADYVGLATTAAQSVFGVGITLASSTVYQFEALYAFSKTATASAHNINSQFGGTATLNNIAYTMVSSASAITSFIDTVNGSSFIAYIQTAASSNFAGPTAVANIWKITHVRGTVSVNLGGTFIPQYNTSVAVGPYTMAAGSYFKIAPIGVANANTNIGGWA
jgi:hypothetical protein